jgi:hypothetical protein
VNAGTTASAGVHYMQVYVDGVNQNTSYASWVDISLPITNGTHRLTVQARLNNGTTVKNTINISVGTSSGGGGGTNGITMTSPVDGSTVTNPVTVSATATSSAGISYIQLYVDTVKQYQVNGSTLNYSLTLATGTHRITTQAKDANGVYYKQTANITVSSGSSGGGGGTTSGVTMTSPVNGTTVSNPVVVKATASSSVAISFIELWVDGVKKTQVSGNTLNYSITLSSGTHRITAQAKDANGTYYKQTAYITVK